MCRVADAAFAPEVGSVAAARRFVSETVARWDLAPLREDALLLTSELVTNALVHAGAGPRVRMAVAGGTLEIGVEDGRPVALTSLEPRRERLTDLSADGGRGLYLVDLISSEWGVAPIGTGKEIWFRLAAVGWTFRRDCTCADRTRDAVDLPSGLRSVPIPGPWDT